MDEQRITLVGAGLAGSLLGTFLARRGLEVHIFEKRPDLRQARLSAGRSINLALARRGIAALEQVGVMDRVRSMLIPMKGRMLHDEEGNLQMVPYGQRPEEVIHSVSRGGLNGLLMDAAEATGRVEISFDRACRSVDLDQRTMEIESHDHSTRETVSWNALVGTDGSASAVRESLMSRTGGTLREEPLGHGYKELSIPPTPEGGFRMEKNALHIWPRGEFMLIALPNTDGSFTVTLFLPHTGEESFASLTDREALHRFFERRFPDAVPLLVNLDEEFFGNPTGHLETIRCEPWSYRSAILLGDAAHAIVPFHGQGMNCAFEDCLIFDSLVEQLDSDWPALFQRFWRDRKPDTEAIADMAVENYLEMRSTVRDAKFQLRKQVGFRLEEMHPERFIPRYSMVMFHTLPYAEAKRRGAVQREILDAVTSLADSADQVDFEQASRLVEQRLEPIERD